MIAEPRTIDPPGVPWCGLALAAILLGSFLVKIHNLEHSALSRWDEIYHAVVAQNVFKHPLTPTLVDRPYLPFDYQKWGENHIWLHKPIVPFWQVALSFLLLGVDTFSLRLPAAILTTAAAGLTYLIGRDLLDRPSALIAAALQAFNPFVMTLVHGYQFADNVDASLLFWVETAIFFLVRSMRTGAWSDVLWAGVAQGLAVLSKAYLGLIVLGIATAAWLLVVCRVVPRDKVRIDLGRIAGMAVVTALVAAPWFAACALRFPDEFRHEQAQVLRHLYTNVEGWGAPWDRVVFDYLIVMYNVFYTPAIVAAVVMLGRAIATRDVGLWIVLAWGAGVVTPHLLAVTKTPSATTLALPAFLLLLGHMIVLGVRGERWSRAALVGILTMCLVWPPKNNPTPGYGFPSADVFGAIMQRQMWVVYHVAAALGFTLVAGAADMLFERSFAAVRERLARPMLVIVVLFCGGALLWLGQSYVRAAWNVTARNAGDTTSVEVGEYARKNLPENAVLLCEDRRDVAGYLAIMFYADRTCYSLRDRDMTELASVLIREGGEPYVVRQRLASPLPLPLVHETPNGTRIYRWTDVALSPR